MGSEKNIIIPAAGDTVQYLSPYTGLERMGTAVSVWAGNIVRIRSHGECRFIMIPCRDITGVIE